MDKQILVKIENLSFRYNQELVLDEINLEIRRGEFLGIIGPNGSGKTTLLKIMLGLLVGQKGNVFLFGQNIKEFSAWSKIGYVPQKAGLTSPNFPLTVAEVIEMANFQGKKGLVVQALESVGLEKQGGRLLRELSGGQQQRVFIARALLSKPQLLILDEPTVGVDADSQQKFWQLLKNLNKEKNLSLVLVSHDIDVVAHEVETVACLNGKLIFHGPPQEVIHGDFLEKLYGKNLRFVVHGH